MTLTSGCPSCAYCSGSSSGFQYCCFVNVFEFGPGELEVFAVLFVSLLFDILSCYLLPESLLLSLTRHSPTSILPDQLSGNHPLFSLLLAILFLAMLLLCYFP